MNKIFLTGRLTREPETKYMQNEKQTAVTRYCLAVPRKIKTDGQECDFINCVSFGKTAEFAERYFRKGIKISIVGRLNTGNYTNKDGVKVYTTDVVVEEQEFAENKNANQQNNERPQSAPENIGDSFMNVPEGIDAEIPFL